MRFGIMAMQIGALIPSGGRPEDLLAHAIGFDHAGLIRQLHGQGFNPIELGGDLSLFIPHAFAPQTVERLAALKQETGVTYTVHLPLWSVEPSTPLTPVRLGSVKALVDIIRATQTLEPEVYVMHATGALAAEFYQMRLPPGAKAVLLRGFQAGARASIQQILAETGIASRKLAIETIEFPFDLTFELAEELDLSICLDTGPCALRLSGPLRSGCRAGAHLAAAGRDPSARLAALDAGRADRVRQGSPGVGQGRPGRGGASAAAGRGALGWPDHLRADRAGGAGLAGDGSGIGIIVHRQLAFQWPEVMGCILKTRTVI